MNNKPCEGCPDSPRYGATCKYWHDCLDYRKWLNWRYTYEREADPQESRQPYHFHDDDREV